MKLICYVFSRSDRVILMIPCSVSIVWTGNTFRSARQTSSFGYWKIRESLQYRSNASISVSFQVVMIGASDLDGYASTVVTLALLFGKRVDVIVLCGLAKPAELLRLNSSGPVVSAGVGVRKSEIVIGSGCSEVCLGGRP